MSMSVPNIKTPRDSQNPSVPILPLSFSRPCRCQCRRLLQSVCGVRRSKSAHRGGGARAGCPSTGWWHYRKNQLLHFFHHLLECICIPFSVYSAGGGR